MHCVFIAASPSVCLVLSFCHIYQCDDVTVNRCFHDNLVSLKVRPLFVPITYLQFAYVNCTMTSLYDENKLCTYLRPEFTKVNTECVTDSEKRKQ